MFLACSRQGYVCNPSLHRNYTVAEILELLTRTRAAAFGGTTTLIDFAVQRKGEKLRYAFDTWMKKAFSRATTDSAFHCIATDLPQFRP